MSTEYTLGKDLPTQSLPFSERKQEAIIGWLVREEKFFRQCLGRLTHSYFSNPYSQKLVTALFAFHQRFQRKPKAEEIAEAPSVIVEDVATRNRLRTHLESCLGSAAIIGLDVLEAELTEWLQARAYQGMIEESVRLYNKQKLPEAIEVVKSKTAEIADMKFVEDTAIDPGNWEYLFNAREEELKDCITLGSSTLDRLMNPAAKSGSLLKKDMTLYLGVVNSGKTRTLSNIIVQNAKRGKHCLFLIHEGNEVDIANLLYSSLISRPEVDAWVTPQLVQEVLYHSPEGRQILEQARDVWREQICFMPMIRAGLTVEEVITAIRRKQDEWAAKHGGRGFDLLADDYPAVLQTVQNARGNMQERNVRHAVYLQFNQISAELDLHSVVAYQANREGAKAARGKSQRSSKRLLMREDIEEAWGPVQTAANLVTITRDDEMAANNHVVHLIEKSRSGPTGCAVVLRSRYGSCVTHHDALGATWYSGTQAYSGLYETMLQQYPDQQVPTTLLLSTAAGRN